MTEEIKSQYINAFPAFISCFLKKMKEDTGLPVVRLAEESKISRPIIYRWMRECSFPKPKSLCTFFYHLISLVEKDEITRQEKVRELMSEAYQCILIDFHERKEHTFC